MNRVEIDNRQTRRWLANFVVGSGLVRVREGQKLLMAPPELKVRARPKPYFDIQRDDTDIVARVYAEERETDDLLQRVVRAQPYSRSRLDIDSWDFNEHAEAERLATERVFKLMEQGAKMVVWISPEGGSYDEGRLNVYLPTMVNGEVALQGWGIPLRFNQKESLQLAQRLVDLGGTTIGALKDAEEVRRQPIGFGLGENEQWIERCKKLMPEFSGIWDFVAAEGEVKNQKVIEKVVTEMKERAGGDNRLFERLMAGAGYKINAAGSHGVSHGFDEEVRSFTIQVIDGKFYTEPVLDSQGRLICPVCGEVISSTDAICSRCGIRLIKN